MIETLKGLLLRRPFEPFQIVLRSGDRLEVERPFQVALGLTQFTYAPARGGDSQVVHRRLDQIADLRSTAARREGNG